MKTRVKGSIVEFVETASRLIIALHFLLLVGYSYGQDRIDLQMLVQETQKMSQDSKEMTLVWWLPEQFWLASLAQHPTVSKAMTDQFVETIRPYTMIAVIDGKMGAFGGVTYTSEATVRTNTKLEDAVGRSYAPLREDKVDADTKNLMQMMKPVLVNMLGPMGQNMHFILFQSKDKGDRSIADAKRDGSFKVIVGSKEFKFRLPLGSVLPPKYDPKTGEKFPGNYNYNPFTGSKLGY
jgi:hypothetical protein